MVAAEAAVSVYQRRMDLVRLFFLLTLPISQAFAWFDGEPTVFGRRR